MLLALYEKVDELSKNQVPLKSRGFINYFFTDVIDVPVTIFSSFFYLFISSWQSFSLIGLFVFISFLIFWLYKEGYRIQKNSEPEKLKEDYSKEPTKTIDVEQNIFPSSEVDLEKPDGISNNQRNPVKLKKGETSEIRDIISESDLNVEKHVSEIDKYLNAIEQHLTEYIELKDPILPLGEDDIILPEESSDFLAKEEKQKNIKKDRPTILVVDDNLALRKYLSSILRGRYNVLQEKNGEGGLKVARKEIPDLIISDIMMPVMDGIEFCKEVRNDSSISYLPFIMLTSKVGDHEKLKGLRSGADGYLQKPFNADVLLETVKNNLSSRKQLLKKIQQIDKGKYTLPVSAEDDFLEKLDEVINSRIDNHELKIEEIAKILNISERQFQRKVKELTGTTPKKYLRCHRLKAAEYLLKNDSGSITEVAYAVGFNNLSLFSSYFKEEFNVLPSKLKSTNKDL